MYCSRVESSYNRNNRGSKQAKKITISSLNDPAELKKTVELLLLPNVKMKKKTFNFKKNNIIFLFFYIK